MDLLDELPPAVSAKELLAPAEGRHAHAARPSGAQAAAGGADTVEGDVR
ncbi:hypothetical protein OHS71_38090 [Streptomyces sp. NBC_00377]|nr:MULTISPECIES: hypothetical protein [unclassified Streptomyces]